MSRPALTEDEIENIRELLRSGMTLKAVALETHHAKSTVAKIRDEMDGVLLTEMTPWEIEKAKILNECWPPRKPKPKTKKRSNKRTLITPYHYPAMKKTKGGK